MSGVEKEIKNILLSYLFEEINARTFKEMEKDLEEITHDGMKYTVKKPTFIVNKSAGGELGIRGEIHNVTMNESYGELDLKIKPTKPKL